MNEHKAGVAPEQPESPQTYDVHLRLVCRVEAGSEAEAADIALEAAAWMGDEHAHHFTVSESECTACHRAPQPEPEGTAGPTENATGVPGDGEQMNILVVPTPGTSFEEDMAERDEAAATTIPKLLEAGAQWVVRLHANLGDEEIRRAVKRYRGIDVKFVLAEDDSTPQERERFVRRWKAAGGSDF